MTRDNAKSLLVGIPLLLFLFGGSYLWRQYRDRDIKQHSKYALGYIFKQTGSLKSGLQWHYKFKYQDKLYEGYRSTHVDYDVKLGDYFLVNFSEKEPAHSKVLYEYRLNIGEEKYVDSIWDSIPKQILHSSFKD